MFTGIITSVGTVLRASTSPAGFELSIQCDYPDLQLGESVAVDGACLTVQSLASRAFTVHIVGTTLERTRFGQYTPGRRVNLERALQVGDRLGGHLVQGHVDGMGSVSSVRQQDDARLLDLNVPPDVGAISIPLGSVTVDGVSLTVNAKPRPTIIQISLVPFTLQHTNLGERQVGDRVHLEADTIGKYVRALLEEKHEG